MKRLVAAFFAAVLCLSLVVPAQASPPPTSVRAVSLGDSYGSGVGANDYQAGTEGTCWRSGNSPSEEAVRQLRTRGVSVTFTDVTCSGATIDDLRRPYHGAVQLDALRADTTLVMLTVGGNDIGFAPHVALCLNGNCAGAPTHLARARLPQMAQNLFRLFGEIRARSPQAQIVLLGYGQPMTSGPNAPGTPGVDLDPICAPQYFSLEERRDGGRLSSDLDLTLRLVVEAVRIGGGNVSFVSPYDSSWPHGVRLDPRFAGRSLCAATVPTQLYRGFDALAPPPPGGIGDAAGQTAILHMNKAGYAQLARLVLVEALGRAA